jgi:hypothetical protein
VCQNLPHTSHTTSNFSDLSQISESAGYGLLQKAFEYWTHDTRVLPPLTSCLCPTPVHPFTPSQSSSCWEKLLGERKSEVSPTRIDQNCTNDCWRVLWGPLGFPVLTSSFHTRWVVTWRECSTPKFPLLFALHLLTCSQSHTSLNEGGICSMTIASVSQYAH